MTPSQTYGLLRSLAIYYARPWKLAKMRKFYSHFLQKDDLAFDVGAHVGNRTYVWQKLGARVIAIEPQALYADLLTNLYGRHAHVSILKAGVGSQASKQTLYVSDRTPTVTSINPHWLKAVKEDDRFANIQWNRQEEVQIFSLDQLIEQYGVPAFCKIDVEGSELEVLQGLSCPLKALSFEYIPVQANEAILCIERLATLANYHYNWSQTESMSWQSPCWLSPKEMVKALKKMQISDKSGDIYARKILS